MTLREDGGAGCHGRDLAGDAGQLFWIQPLSSRPEGATTAGSRGQRCRPAPVVPRPAVPLV